MPRTPLPVNTLNGNPAGIAPVAEVACDPAASPNGNVINNYGGTMWLEITSTAAGPLSFVLNTPGTVQGREIANDTVSISGVGTKRRLGPFPKAVYGDNLEFNGPATITVVAYQIVEP